tara:strand:- start:921 stop:1325 length:405 start_codon:yes stop_codon:yes gene_type:complete
MNSEYSHNPLTEVALALSMAFFSIMVLSIFALSHSSVNKEKTSISIQKNKKTIEQNKTKKRELIFYFKNKFYNKNFEIWNNTEKSHIKSNFLIAVPSNITVKKLFKIKETLKNLNIKITQQNKEWNNAFKTKIK